MANQYVAALKSASAARFLRDQELKINNFGVGTLRVDLIFRTRYVDEGFESTVPRELWVDVRGEADSLREAIDAFWPAANAVIPVIAFSANAAVDFLELELAYDNTASQQEHEFFQSFVQEGRSIPTEGRGLNPKATVALIRGIADHPDGERLRRAISQYHLALSHWKRGEEILAVAHLFMGAEALTEVLLRNISLNAKTSESELAEMWGLNSRDLEAQHRLHPAMLAEVRRRVLFQGDPETHKHAKAASDGFEHGFADYVELRNRALAARHRTAAYLRSAIIDLVAINGEDRTTLLQAPFDSPQPLAGFTKYLRGRLLGDANNLAAAGQEYPLMRWQTRIKSFKMMDEHKCSMDLDETFTAVLGEGVQFRLGSVEVWREPKNE